MKQFMLLMVGFEQPTQEIMLAWNDWFALVGDHIVQKGHFPRGFEISKSGTQDLPFDHNAITGYVIIKAESFEEAQNLAGSNPYITAIRIYEIMGG